MTKKILTWLGCVVDALVPPTCGLCGRRTPGTRRLRYHLEDVHGAVFTPEAPAARPVWMGVAW